MILLVNRQVAIISFVLKMRMVKETGKGREFLKAQNRDENQYKRGNWINSFKDQFNHDTHEDLEIVENCNNVLGEGLDKEDHSEEKVSDKY